MNFIVRYETDQYPRPGGGLYRRAGKGGTGSGGGQKGAAGAVRPQDGVRLPQGGQPVPGDGSQAPHPQAGAGEGLPVQ